MRKELPAGIDVRSGRSRCWYYLEFQCNVPNGNNPKTIRLRLGKMRGYLGDAPETEVTRLYRGLTVNSSLMFSFGSAASVSQRKIGRVPWSQVTASEFAKFVRQRVMGIFFDPATLKHKGSSPMRSSMPDIPSASQLKSVCLSIRHDFGLLPESEREEMLHRAKEWWRAIAKEVNR